MVKNIDFENLPLETDNISMNLSDLNEVRNSLEVMHMRGIIQGRNQVNVQQKYDV